MPQQAPLTPSKTHFSCCLVLSGFGFSPQAEAEYQVRRAAVIKPASINFEA